MDRLIICLKHLYWILSARWVRLSFEFGGRILNWDARKFLRATVFALSGHNCWQATVF